MNKRQAESLLMVLAVVALLALVVPLTLSGYGSFNDWGDSWGGDAWSAVHDWLGQAFLVVVLAHLFLIVALSVLRRKNQAQHMLTGCVEGHGPDLVKNNRGWLAMTLLVAVLAYGAWEWQQSPRGLIPADAVSGLFRHHGSA